MRDECEHGVLRRSCTVCEKVEPALLVAQERAARAEEQRDKLANGAIEALVKTGGAAPSSALTGPHILMMLDDLAEYTNELAARCDQLREALNDLLNDCINFDGGKLTDCIMAEASKALSRTPAASLAHIRAEVIESLQFPVFLRKMWTGNELQEWLKNAADVARQSASQADGDNNG